MEFSSSWAKNMKQANSLLTIVGNSKALVEGQKYISTKLDWLEKNFNIA